jgi:hypothetical protein
MELGRQIRPDGMYLLLNNVKVVDKPVSGRRD